jgi:hypothetical protein
MVGALYAVVRPKDRRGALLIDCDRSRLDALAAFVITIGLFWMNFRRHTERVLNRFASSDENTLLGLSTGVWYCIAALLATAPALYALYRYRRGDRGLFPRSAFGKGAGVTLLILSATAAAQLLDGHPTRVSLIGNLCIWLPAAMAACLIMSFSPDEAQTIARTEAGVSRKNECWRVGRRYAFVCALVPAVLLAITGLSTANQEGIFGDRGRLRFGPNAYWRQTARLIGSWNVVGRANEVGAGAQWTENLSLSQLEFDAQRNTVATLPGGERVEAHRWFLKNQYIWLQWFSKLTGHAERAEVPLQFREQRLYIAWPPHRPREYLVLERDEGGAANPVLP